MCDFVYFSVIIVWVSGLSYPTLRDAFSWSRRDCRLGDMGGFADDGGRGEFLRMPLTARLGLYGALEEKSEGMYITLRVCIGDVGPAPGVSAEKGKGFGPEGSIGPADNGGVDAICWLGNMTIVCWAGDMGLALRGVSGYVAVKGVCIL
jgi:hypothetical protein